ncbi:putative carboxylesterase 11 [Apostasia shenzhenica]|uniref:Putative carboxylesterase 11 n=1 Tax=Apostasia shenzhenica TaxID=1088818 RepID=A0A2I0AK29_9ASPA|nr:putative carboxylesterase 11 [Apostasia shenzhenica]
MPSVAVKLYSVFFKLVLKHRLQSRLDAAAADEFGVTSRPEESTAPANPSFAADGVATKDIHIDPLTALSLRIFLPDTFINTGRASARHPSSSDLDSSLRTNGVSAASAAADRRSDDGAGSVAPYRGYLPSPRSHQRSVSRRLPVILQFHGGGFVSGSNTSTANDLFCRRIVKLLDVIVISVGYRLAPENRYPAAFDDGLKVLHWVAKQANLAECSKSIGSGRGSDAKRMDSQRHIVNAFGAATVEPWLAAHGDPSRQFNGTLTNSLLCVLLGVSCGANISDFLARKAVELGKLLDPVKVVAQVLMYPFFIGSVPTHSEIKLANSYFYDKAMCILSWKLFLPESEFSLDHPAANPLVPGRGPPSLKLMPPTLTVVAEHDWMRDRAIAYSEELRKVNVDAPVLEYKDAVHEFATLDILLKTPQAQACAEDIAIWVKKYISTRGHEFSY